jgi:hypothetical protein
MRMKILSVMMLAGTVIGCASNPPPPPPAPAPAPAPAPVVLGPVDGVYKGMAVLPDDAVKGCAKMTKPQTVTVKKNSFVLGGLKATIGPDGAITATSHKGASLTGTASATGLDLTSVKGKCSYHYTLTKA